MYFIDMLILILLISCLFIITDKVKLDDGSAPELRDFQSSNLTVYQGMKIVMQCKVYSLHPVEIRWFKEAQDGFTFKNSSYIRLNSSSHIFLDKDIYQSKLMIDKATENDSGVYTCAAINSLGVVYKDTYVDVISLEEMKYWQDSTSLPMLFFIPAGLALIPILVWLWYYRRKRNIRRKEILASLEQNNIKYYPVF